MGRGVGSRIVGSNGYESVSGCKVLGVMGSGR